MDSGMHSLRPVPGHAWLPALFAITLVACDDTDGTVAPPDPVATVVVVPVAADLAVGQTVQLAALARTSSGAPVQVDGFTWSSDEETVATVDAGGLVTAVGGGTADVSATVDGTSGASRISVNPVVEPPPPPPIPSIASIEPGSIQAGWGSFSLVVRGTGFGPSSRVLWNEMHLETVFFSDEEIQGRVTPPLVSSEGTAEVSVETPGEPPLRSGTVTFTIHSRPATLVELLVPGNAVFQGNRVRLAARARDQFGDVIPGKTITWTASDTLVARIEGDHLVGRSLGSVTLVASAFPTSRGMTYHVVAPPDVDLMFDASSSSVSDVLVQSLGPGGTVTPLVSTGAAAMQASSTADGSRIAYAAVDATGNLDVWVVNRDGSGRTRLTDDPAADDQPSWSPDGQHIAFRSTRSGKSDIWVMDADGSNPTNLTAAEVWIPEELNDHPAWSPDGERIAFSRGFGLGQSLYTVAPDGSGMMDLATRAGSDLLEPAWSPTGLTIALHRYDRMARASALELVTSDAGETVFPLGGAPSGAMSPVWLDRRWMAVEASAQPAWEGQTIVLFTVDANAFRVVPISPARGTLANPAPLPR